VSETKGRGIVKAITDKLPCPGDVEATRSNDVRGEAELNDVRIHPR